MTTKSKYTFDEYVKALGATSKEGMALAQEVRNYFMDNPGLLNNLSNEEWAKLPKDEQTMIIKAKS